MTYVPENGEMPKDPFIPGIGFREDASVRERWAEEQRLAHERLTAHQGHGCCGCGCGGNIIGPGQFKPENQQEPEIDPELMRILREATQQFREETAAAAGRRTVDSYPGAMERLAGGTDADSTRSDSGEARGAGAPSSDRGRADDPPGGDPA